MVPAASQMEQAAKEVGGSYNNLPRTKGEGRIAADAASDPARSG